MLSKKNIIYVWRWLLALASVVLLAWLFWQNLVPSGVLVLEHKKGDANSPITDLHPKKRVVDLPEDKESQRFYLEPVYFDARAPRVFDRVKVNIIWQNQNQPILELGARQSRDAFAFVLKPLQNKIIDNLNWQCSRYDEIVFCQKQSKYQNLSQFFNTPPNEEVVTYNYSLPENIKSQNLSSLIDLADYNYLVANYEPPIDLGGGRYQREIEFSWRDFALYINEISFVISAPQLNKLGGQIVVDGIQVELERDPLDWQGFVDYIKDQLKRLRK